ncbi:hypothetical protein ACIRFH_02740 [Streptomyces sp. NPDC093586]|uniref:hypothetical protein n=1 Tax=Streptomyces sp. NPDC093586 TaxID=3366042 RepID=UPI00382DDE7B
MAAGSATTSSTTSWPGVPYGRPQPSSWCEASRRARRAPSGAALERKAKEAAAVKAGTPVEAVVMPRRSRFDGSPDQAFRSYGRCL